MIIAGGCYIETCESPRWYGVFGSAGRAALALAELSSSVVLHTFYPTNRVEDLKLLAEAGVQLHLTQSSTPLVFAYFHPLSKPVLAPKPTPTIAQPIYVEGEAVLRFGCMEGTIIVDGGRVVYDPQSSDTNEPFRKNGSQARSLALVLNEEELRIRGRSDDLAEASSEAMLFEGADVLVLKRGVKGVRVYDLNGSSWEVPAYFSSSVFKIGSGDVFSAAFSHYWAEVGLPAAAAAEKASRSVAHYCGTRQLPLPSIDQLQRATPVSISNAGAIEVVGLANNLGGRWLLEETCWCLTSLGVITVAPALRDGQIILPTCRLILADQFAPTDLHSLKGSRLKTIVLSETASHDPRTLSSIATFVTHDFTTALYHAAWTAMI